MIHRQRNTPHIEDSKSHQDELQLPPADTDDCPLESYGNFRPTAFDARGLALSDRQEWLVVPINRTRDSDTLSESNFEVALQSLGGESDSVEVHRFGHWGPGWFEIILVAPNTPEALIAEEIDEAISNYPILDEFHFSELEYERAAACWEQLSIRARIETCQRFDVSIFAARTDEIPQDKTGEIVGYLAE